ncbi:MAG: FtsX-like permease family protein [Acidobacteriota bacterium]|nr:FtsX-like permease family protein [Acidobacteriota bacterium]
MSVVTRSAVDPTSLTNAIRREVQAIDKDQPILEARTMNERIAESIAARRFSMLLFVVFAGIALVLAVVGIYGVMSYTVARRTHEIGIRMALGAGRGDVLRLVVGQGMILAAVGISIGVIAAFALTRVISSLLYGVSATDPVTFVGVAMLLTIVALLACYVPARRAAKVDPMVALRYE